MATTMAKVTEIKKHLVTEMEKPKERARDLMKQTDSDLGIYLVRDLDL